MIAETEAAEAEKRQAALEEQQAKIIELQANIETLRAVSGIQLVTVSYPTRQHQMWETVVRISV